MRRMKGSEKGFSTWKQRIESQREGEVALQIETGKERTPKKEGSFLL